MPIEYNDPGVPMSNQEIKQKWLEALRSGEYLQTKGTLKGRQDPNDPVGYCCLGVLCSVIGEEPPTEGGKLPLGVWYCDTGPQDLYKMVENILGGKTLPFCLADMNDNGATFQEIADYVEKEWKNA